MNTNLVQKIVLPALILALVVGPAAASAHNGGDTSDKTIARPATLVQLAGGGGALVRGAEVTAVNDDVITAETDLGDVELTWTIDVDSDTELVTAGGGEFDLDEIDVGDTVSFSGTLASNFRVDAGVLKDWSIDEDEDGKDRMKDFGLKLRDWFNGHFGFWKK